MFADVKIIHVVAGRGDPGVITFAESDRNIIWRKGDIFR
jgi:hypothetical protein